MSDPIPPARSVNPEVDETISDWIERLVAKDPAERTRSAGEARDELEEIVIALVGPRWRRSARLVEPSRRPPDSPAGPATPPPSRAARPPLMPTFEVPDWGPEAPTRRLDEGDDPPQAATVMPEPPTRRLDEQSEPQGKRRRGVRRFVKATLVLVALLFVLAVAFGDRGSKPAGSTGAEAAAAPTTNVSGPDLALRVPRGWSRLQRPPELGLPLSGATAAAPGGRRAGPVVEFGTVKRDAGSNDALLAPAFLASLGQAPGTPPPRTAVRLPEQGLEAWRYRNLRPVGIRDAVTVYTVPTSEGVATVACAIPPGQAAGLTRQCDAIASTLRLRRGTAYPIGPSKAYASTLNGALAELQQSTDANEATLEQSQTVSGQAAAATALASAYEAAASQLAALDLSPADSAVNERLVSALRAAGRAYTLAARAASAGDADSYRTASAAIPGVKTQVNAALAGVRGAGYKPAGTGQTGTGQTGTGEAAPPTASRPEAAQPAQPESDVGDSRSDDPSDDQEED